MRTSKIQQQYAADPSRRRWLNQCVLCQRLGYKPEMPAKTTARVRLGSDFADFTTGIGWSIRKVFDPLPVDDLGRCEDCSRY